MSETNRYIFSDFYNLRLELLVYRVKSIGFGCFVRGRAAPAGFCVDRIVQEVNRKGILVKLRGFVPSILPTKVYGMRYAGSRSSL